MKWGDGAVGFLFQPRSMASLQSLMWSVTTPLIFPIYPFMAHSIKIMPVRIEQKIVLYLMTV